MNGLRTAELTHVHKYFPDITINVPSRQGSNQMLSDSSCIPTSLDYFRANNTGVIKNQDEDFKSGSDRIYLKLLKEPRQVMNRSHLQLEKNL